MPKSILFALFLIILLSSFAAPANAQTETVTPIKHVIIIMMENHSFDNIYGVYPTDNKTHSNSLIASIERPINLLTLQNAPSLEAVPNGTFATADPVEGYGPYHDDWNNGSMNGFQSNSGPQSMTYFTSSQLAVEWDWAEEYAIGDMYFASYMSETAPNRLMSLAAFTPVINDEGPPPYIPINQSIFAELEHFGVSWGYYVDELNGIPYPLNYFWGIQSYNNSIHGLSTFFSQLENGALPSVCWVMPVGGGLSGISQHPSDNVTFGELWLLNIVDHVMLSRYWNSSAIFITYDEGGGYYDQIPPPKLDGNLLGFRVPLIVISPYAKENYVSNTVLNHASLLAFIDYNWRMPPLNTFVADSSIPIDFFNFNKPYADGSLLRGPLVMGNSTGYPLAPQIPFNELPYSRIGESNLTLAGLGLQPFISVNSSYTPAYESAPITAAVAIVLILLLVLARRITAKKVNKKL